MKKYLRKQLNDCQKELNTIKRIIPRDPLNTSVYFLTLYSLVKTCGTIEYVFKAIISDFFDKSKIKQIKYYIAKSIRESSANPRYSKICETLEKFDETWNNDFKANINILPDKNKLISSLNSLVNDRNEFAHGKNPTVSFSSICSYYQDAIKIINILDKSIK